MDNVFDWTINMLSLCHQKESGKAFAESQTRSLVLAIRRREESPSPPPLRQGKERREQEMQERKWRRT